MNINYNYFIIKIDINGKKAINRIKPCLGFQLFELPIISLINPIFHNPILRTPNQRVQFVSL